MITDWPGGIYVSPSIPGSRNGSIIAGTWAAMLFNGKKGYKDKILEIIELKEQILEDLEEISQLEVIGNPSTTIIAFVFSVIRSSILLQSIFKVSSSASQNTGLAPVYKTQFELAAKVMAGTITSSPGFKPNVRQTI